MFINLDMPGLQMPPSTVRRLLPGIVAAAFAGMLALSVILTALLLDSFLVRYDRGSVTTMLPGFVYANALMMKLGLLEAAVLGVVAVWSLFSARRSKDDAVLNRIPFCAIGSVLLPAVAPFVGTLSILVTQAIVGKPVGDTLDYFTTISRTGVFALIGVLAVSLVLSITALVRRERPIGFSIVGLSTTALLLTLFFYWEFYKYGFDQDRWNQSDF